MHTLQPLPNLISNFKALIAFIGILTAAFAGGYLLSNYNNSKTYSLLLGEQNSTIEELSIVRNENTSLNQILSKKDEKTKELKEIISSYEEKPVEIKYIVKTETIIKGKEEEKENLPEEYLFKLENGLPVSKFKKLEDGYLFKTFDIEFDATVVISDDETAVLLTGKSSYDQERRRINISKTETKKIREIKLFEPQVSLAVLGSLTLSLEDSISGDLLLSLGFPFFHPSEHVDVLSPRLSANGSVFQVGVDAFSYNVGHNIPVLTDLWIGSGLALEAPSGNFSLNVNIGSKF